MSKFFGKKIFIQIIFILFVQISFAEYPPEGKDAKYLTSAEEKTNAHVYMGSGTSQDYGSNIQITADFPAYSSDGVDIIILLSQPPVYDLYAVNRNGSWIPTKESILFAEGQKEPLNSVILYDMLVYSKLPAWDMTGIWYLAYMVYPTGNPSSYELTFYDFEATTSTSPQGSPDKEEKNDFIVSVYESLGLGTPTKSDILSLSSTLNISVLPVESNGYDPHTVSFSCTSESGTPPYSFSWDFGDGDFGNNQNEVHTYTNPGDYAAIVIVTDSEEQIGSKTIPVTVSKPEYINQPPTASITADVTEGQAPLLVNFIGTGSDPEAQSLTFWWNFEDGTTVEGTTASYTYDNPGTYTVVFTVQDSDEMRATAKESIKVTAALEPVCDNVHTELCYGQTDCELAGGFWCDDQCQIVKCAEPEPVCDSSNINLCLDQVSCDSAGAFWCNESCQITECELPAEPVLSSGIGKAIIIAAGGAHKGNTLFGTTNEYCQLFSFYLKKRGYTDDDIIYMSPVTPLTDAGHQDTDNHDYKLFSPEIELNQAFTEASQALSQDQQFVLYIHGHASPDSIKINNDYQLSSAKLKSLLDKIPTGIQQIVIIDTCYSGSVLDELSGVENRVVLTSSDADSVAWTSERWNFSKKLFYGIRLNLSVWDAFQATEEMILGNSKIFGDQRPQLDDTQDGFYSSKDGPLSSTIFIGKEGMTQAEPPVIIRIHDAIEILSDQSTTTLWVKTSPSNEGIKKVTATLIKPDFQLASYEGEDTQVVETIEVELLYNLSKERYEIDHDFREAGIWKIMYEAEGTEGDLSDVRFGEVTAPGVTIPVLLDTWTNQTVYTYGDELSLGVDINSQIECDLYALLIYPDGVTLITIYYPGHFSMPLEILPYQEDVEVSSNRSISVINKTISQAFSPGLYIYGVIATEPNVDVLQGEWVNLAYDLFEVTNAMPSNQTGTDNDGDGYTVEAGDCNDDDPNINPGATDTLLDGIDQDCNKGPFD